MNTQQIKTKQFIAALLMIILIFQSPLYAFAALYGDTDDSTTFITDVADIATSDTVETDEIVEDENETVHIDHETDTLTETDEIETVHTGNENDTLTETAESIAPTAVFTTIGLPILIAVIGIAPDLIDLIPSGPTGPSDSVWGGVTDFVNHGIFQGYTMYVGEYYLQLSDDQIRTMIFQHGNLWIGNSVVNALPVYRLREASLGNGAAISFRINTNPFGSSSIRNISTRPQFPPFQPPITKSDEQIMVAQVELGVSEFEGGVVVYNTLDLRVVLTAFPNIGWNFSGWYEDDLNIGISPALQFETTSPRELEARFAFVGDAYIDESIIIDDISTDDSSNTDNLLSEPPVTGQVPGIVRNLIINIWGNTGLLRSHHITGVAIPPVLFELVETPGWQAWFLSAHPQVLALNSLEEVSDISSIIGPLVSETMHQFQEGHLTLAQLIQLESQLTTLLLNMVFDLYWSDNLAPWFVTIVHACMNK